MEQGLFAKYIRTVKERTHAKQEIIASLLEQTGIQIEESEITLSKKKVILSMSSVKKTALIQKGSKDYLQTLGYTLQV